MTRCGTDSTRTRFLLEPMSICFKRPHCRVRSDVSRHFVPTEPGYQMRDRSIGANLSCG